LVDQASQGQDEEEEKAPKTAAEREEEERAAIDAKTRKFEADLEAI
jgi:hypothetical protein